MPLDFGDTQVCYSPSPFKRTVAPIVRTIGAAAQAFSAILWQRTRGGSLAPIVSAAGGAYDAP